MAQTVGKVPKRKTSSSDGAARKKAKTQHRSMNDLPWKVVSHKQAAGFDSALDGMMELEEVDGVEVCYEETNGGKVVRFNVVNDASEDLPGEDVDESGSSSVAQDGILAPEIEETFDTKTLLPNWHEFSLHPQLSRAMYAQEFTSPTPIQSKALPAALKGKDVIGIAETGSGKTLAYGLPILHCLLNEATSQPRPRNAKVGRPVRALVLAPTRELALQVASHLNSVLSPIDVSAISIKLEEAESSDVLKASDPKSNKKSAKGKGKATVAAPKIGATDAKRPPLVSVAAIVGGMSAQKQRRILDRGVDVLVATPGRLWDILQEDDALASQLKNLKFLVLDEADRMIETGHFVELENILRLTLRQNKDDQIDPLSEHADESAEEEVEPTDTTDGLQTFVFSATLSKDLQRNLKRQWRPKGGKKRKPASTLDDLLLRLDFRDPDPEIIDISPEGGVVSSLKESQINCLVTDKDAYLYYFLMRYPGRSLIFFSSIDGIRRIMPLISLLGVHAFPLHSQLEQRQRLKNLDRFKTTANSILLATDIASRGLDIPAVDHVIHYQIPRSADVYVHRNGRTARAMRSGFSLLMCAPDERRLVRALLGSLGRQEEDIPEMSVELYLLDKLKVRIKLARQIDNAQHKIKKENHEKNWIRKAAEEMEIELDSDLAQSSDDDEHREPSKKQGKTRKAKTAALKEELKALLAQPLIARGVSARYITSGSRPVVDGIIAGDNHETMVGLPKSVAGTDVAPSRRKKTKKVVAKTEEFEEWSGIEP